MVGDKPYNIIIAGIGGQGVQTLTKVLWRLCAASDIECTGAIFKGGAQRLGSVHSELRMALVPIPGFENYSTEIPFGDLDLLVGLEPWEALRYSRFYGEDTSIVCNTFCSPFFLERRTGPTISDPMAELRKLGHTMLSDDFRALSISRFGNISMTNYLIGLRAIEALDFPFSSEDYEDIFQDTISTR